MPLNTREQNPNTSKISPAANGGAGIDRGQCSWFERPLTGNNIGDRLAIVDINFATFVWNGSAWINPMFTSSGDGVAGVDGVTTWCLVWKGTQAEYDAIPVKSATVLYVIV